MQKVDPEHKLEVKCEEHTMQIQKLQAENEQVNFFSLFFLFAKEIFLIEKWKKEYDCEGKGCPNFACTSVAYLTTFILSLCCVQSQTALRDIMLKYQQQHAEVEELKEKLIQVWLYQLPYHILHSRVNSKHSKA